MGGGGGRGEEEGEGRGGEGGEGKGREWEGYGRVLKVKRKGVIEEYLRSVDWNGVLELESLEWSDTLE